MVLDTCLRLSLLWLWKEVVIMTEIWTLYIGSSKTIHSLTSSRYLQRGILEPSNLPSPELINFEGGFLRRANGFKIIWSVEQHFILLQYTKYGQRGGNILISSKNYFKEPETEETIAKNIITECIVKFPSEVFGGTRKDSVYLFSLQYYCSLSDDLSYQHKPNGSLAACLRECLAWEILSTELNQQGNARPITFPPMDSV